LSFLKCSLLLLLLLLPPPPRRCPTLSLTTASWCLLCWTCTLTNFTLKCSSSAALLPAAAAPPPPPQVSHTEPDHSFLVPAVLDLYPEATVVASKVALNFLAGLTNRCDCLGGCGGGGGQHTRFWGAGTPCVQMPRMVWSCALSVMLVGPVP
jgi:hypothetical protein